MKKHIEEHPEYGELGIFAGYGEADCLHVAIHRFEDGRTQCKDCLLIWEAKPTDSES